MSEIIEILKFGVIVVGLYALFISLHTLIIGETLGMGLNLFTLMIMLIFTLSLLIGYFIPKLKL